jgi:dihydroorotase/allantoinase
VLIESAKIPIANELITAHIYVEDGIIKKIGKLLPAQKADLTINGARLIALPGMIDAHVHLRDSDLSYKETFQTGTQAAAAGGFTTVLDMPNSKPPTISAQILADRKSRTQGHLYVNVGFQGALLEDSRELSEMAEKGAVSFKLYLNKSLEPFDSGDDARIANAFRAAKAIDALVTVHAEDGRAIGRVQQRSIAEGKVGVRDFLRGHSPDMEISAVKRILNFARRWGVRIHICHSTIPEAVRLAKRMHGATCEATAHHLLLNEAVFRRQGTLALCVPPIRSERNRRGLWSLFAAGQVDILASDHAPHTLDEKKSDDAWKAASGVPGLETSLPAMFNQVVHGKLTLQRLIQATATLPAKIFRLGKKGKLKEGYDADIVLVDPKSRFKVQPEEFLSKAKYSPFEHMSFTGRAAYTIVNGVLVAERGRIVGPASGNVLKKSG